MGRPPTGCPFLLDFVLPTTTGLTARSYDGKVAEAKSRSSAPLIFCLPIKPFPTPSTRSTDADRVLLRLPVESRDIPAVVSRIISAAGGGVFPGLFVICSRGQTVGFGRV